MTAVIDTEATTGKLGSRTNANSYAFLNAYSRLGHTSKAYSFFNIRRELNYSLTPFKDENGDVTQPNDALLLIRSMRHSNAITNTSWSLMNDPEPVIDTVLLSMRNSKTKLTKPFVAELLEVFARAATVPFRGTSARDNDRHRKSMCLKAVRYHRKLTNHGMPGLSAVGSDVVIANVMVKVHSRAGLLEVAEGHWEDWFKNFSPDSVSYNTVLWGYAKAGQTFKTKSWLTSMTNAGVAPTVDTAEAVVRGGVVNGDLQGAVEDVQNLWNQHKVLVSAKSVTDLLDACLKSGEEFEAKRLLYFILQVFDSQRGEYVAVDDHQVRRVVASWMRDGKLERDSLVKLFEKHGFVLAFDEEGNLKE